MAGEISEAQKGQFFAALDAGESVDSAAKIAGIPRLVARAWAKKRAGGPASAAPAAAPPPKAPAAGGGIVVHRVEAPGEGMGVPSGSSAGGADGARRAAAESTPPPKAEKVDAKPFTPPLVDPMAVEMLLVFAQFLVRRSTQAVCALADVEYRDEFGDLSKKEEEELRLFAPGTIALMGPTFFFLLKYGSPICFLVALLGASGARAVAIAKVSPKRRKDGAGAAGARPAAPPPAAGGAAAAAAAARPAPPPPPAPPRAAARPAPPERWQDPEYPDVEFFEPTIEGSFYEEK
ncbi:MAG TPA: hypothetical protein VKW04_18260 [Planctomycetota bacterium]|nr:hypothetical protein [Planctomycetota bacterium]